MRAEGQLLGVWIAIMMSCCSAGCGSQDDANSSSKRGNVRLVSDGSIGNSLRYDRSTGKTSRLAWRDSARSVMWEDIPETGLVSKGDFEVQVVQTSKRNFVAIRIDRLSGKTWIDLDGAWKPVDELTLEHN